MHTCYPHHMQRNLYRYNVPFPNSNIGYPCLRASPDTALADRHRPEPLGHRRQDGPATAAETDATTTTGSYGTIIIFHDRLILVYLQTDTYFGTHEPNKHPFLPNSITTSTRTPSSSWRTSSPGSSLRSRPRPPPPPPPRRRPRTTSSSSTDPTPSAHRCDKLLLNCSGRPCSWFLLNMISKYLHLKVFS